MSHRAFPVENSTFLYTDTSGYNVAFHSACGGQIICSPSNKIAINLLAYLDGIAMYYYMLKDHIDLGDQIDFYLDGFLKSLRAENGDA